MNPAELLRALHQDEDFQHWQNEHPKCYLSHFFNLLDEKQELVQEWQIGYYDSTSDTITTFISKIGGFEIQGNQQIFKKEQDSIEPLDIKNADFTFAQAIELCRKNFSSLFLPEITGEGFIILQQLQGKTLWNVTCISKSVKFLNIKIDATTGEIDSHQKISMMEKGPKGVKLEQKS